MPDTAPATDPGGTLDRPGGGLALNRAKPSGHIKLALGDGHQAIQSNAAGRSKWDPDAKMVRLVDIEYFAAECVNPPPGIKSVD
jgi:hypothetical protein